MAHIIHNVAPNIAASNTNVARVLLNNTAADSNNIRALPLPNVQRDAPSIVLRRYPPQNARQHNNRPCQARNVRHVPKVRPAAGAVGAAGAVVAPALVHNRTARHVRITSRSP